MIYLPSAPAPAVCGPAAMSASFGAKVAVAEEGYLGGTCVNVGCIPKKLLVYASHYGEDFEISRVSAGR